MTSVQKEESFDPLAAFLDGENFGGSQVDEETKASDVNDDKFFEMEPS